METSFSAVQLKKKKEERNQRKNTNSVYAELECKSLPIE